MEGVVTDYPEALRAMMISHGIDMEEERAAKLRDTRIAGLKALRWQCRYLHYHQDLLATAKASRYEVLDELVESKIRHEEGEVRRIEREIERIPGVTMADVAHALSLDESDLQTDDLFEEALDREEELFWQKTREQHDPFSRKPPKDLSKDVVYPAVNPFAF